MKYKGIKKLYYSISEISEKLGIKASVIRYWETEFKDLAPQKNRAGNRIYKEDDIDTIRLIHHYVHEKHLSIHDANDLIQDLKKEHLYKRKVKELSTVPPVSMLEEEEVVIDTIDLIKDEVITPLPEVDTFEIEQDEHDIPFNEGFRIVSSDQQLVSKPEPFVQMVQEEEQEEEIKPKSQENLEFEIVSPTKETFIYPLDEPIEDEIDIDEPQNASISLDITPEPVPEPEPEPEPEVQKYEDPELKILLKKIAENINDIIGILNE